MHLLESGLHDYGVEVTILCLESIEGVAVCRRKDEALQSSPALTHILEHFLKVHVNLYTHILYTCTCTVTCTCTQCTCIIMYVYTCTCTCTAYDRYIIALHVNSVHWLSTLWYMHTCCMFPDTYYTYNTCMACAHSPSLSMAHVHCILHFSIIMTI